MFSLMNKLFCICVSDDIVFASVLFGLRNVIKYCCHCSPVI
uniref:Uncharacterized protein n=1 Tax=Anguilla anguilla TaxID=7936 RepID=A0A0E9XVD8_ANGAN